MLCFGLFVMWCSVAEPTVANGATFCEIVKKQDVTWSRNDTRASKENLDRLFRKGKKLCGWK